MAPSSTISVMRRPIRPLPGNHALEDKPSIRPGGRFVMCEDARYILSVRVACRATLSVIGTFAAGVLPIRKVPSTLAHGSRWMILVNSHSARRFDVSKAGRMRDDELKVRVLRREMEAAGFVGLESRTVG